MRGETVPAGISCRDDSRFPEVLAGESEFAIRRAVERLREGLFDPVAVRLLTAHEDRLQREAERGFRAVDEARPTHLGVVGAYGQGKSHSLVYIQDLALREGFAVSLISLDPREIPFHYVREVYRAAMARLQLPGTDRSFPVVWKKWVQEELKEREDAADSVLGLLPEKMPTLFRFVLAAMARGNVSLSEREKRLKKHAGFRPREFPQSLRRALEGEAVPLPRLRNALKYRGIAVPRGESLSRRQPEAFVDMMEAFSCLLQRMGYRGWVLLFDEGEAVAQARSPFARSRSYGILHRLFGLDPSSGPSCIYPVFAFTEDFLQRVKGEAYDKVLVRGEREIPYFRRNYAEEWRHLNLYRLSDLSAQEWEELSRRLVCLHARAYGWSPPEEAVIQQMQRRLAALRAQETRLKLKALVDSLDLAHQEQVL